MKRYAKWIALMMGISVIGCSLGGCGGGNTQTSKTAETAGETADETTAAAETTDEADAAKEAANESGGEAFQVEVWSQDASKEATMKPLIEEWNNTTGKEQGIFINYSCTTDLQNMLDLGMQSGELPALTDQYSTVPFDDGGYIYPIAKVAGGQEFLDDWAERIGQDYGNFSKLKGEVYYPLYSLGGPALYYNKDMFKAAGIVDENGEAKAPATWDEFVAAAEALSADGSTYGLALPGQWRSCCDYDAIRILWNASEQPPARVDWSNNKVIIDCATSFDALAEIYKNGWCVPGVESTDNDPARSYFSEGAAGMFIGYSWDIGVFTTQYVADFDWGVCQLMADDGTDYGCCLSSGSAYIPTVAVKDMSEEEQQKVMEVMNFFYSDEVGVKLVEAGVLYPANNTFVEQADLGSLSQQVVDLLDAYSKGRVMENVGIPTTVYENISTVKDATWENSVLLKVMKGEMTTEEGMTELSDAYTETLQQCIDSGLINPDDWK